MSYQLGIDFGTTFTAAVLCRASPGEPEIVDLGAGRAAIPSALHLDVDGTVTVGEPALRLAATEPGLPPVVGQLVFLDGSQSSGAARFRWTQLAGAWVVLSGQAAVTTFRPPAPGLYVFELEVDDGAVRSAPVRVEVNVSEQGVE